MALHVTFLRTLCATGVSFLCLSGVATAQACDMVELTSASNVTIAAQQNFACLASKIEALEAANTDLSNQVGSLSSVFPAGTVVAFDRDAQTSGTCPEGWGEWLEGRGKMIVGAGDPSEAPAKFGFDESGEPLNHYVRGQHGGANDHTLVVNEMPQHVHGGVVGSGKLVDGPFEYVARPKPSDPEGAFGDRDDVVGNVVGHDGANRPHNNMPPFIALYYCKKL